MILINIVPQMLMNKLKLHSDKEKERFSILIHYQN